MPKRRYSPYKKFRALILPAIAFIIILAVIILVVRSCGDKSESDDTGKDSDLGYNYPRESDDPDNTGEFYIPIDREPEHDNSVPSPSPLTEAELEAAKLKVTQDLGTEYLDKFYFLCDSPIYGLLSYGMLAGGTETDRVISGVSSSLSVLFGGDTLVYDKETDTVIRLSDKIKSISPQFLLLSVGSDDIKNHKGLSYSSFKSAYSELISALKKASPETVIICMPILPSSAGEGFTIYDAEKYNKYILEAAAESGAYYIEIASAFASSGGYLRIDCDGGDSRLNTTGLKRLTELIRTYGIITESTETETETEE